MQASGPQAASIEDTFSHVHGSLGKRAPAGPELRSELAIVTGLAKATLPEIRAGPGIDGPATMHWCATSSPKPGPINSATSTRDVRAGWFLSRQCGARPRLENRKRQGGVHAAHGHVGERHRRCARSLQPHHHALERPIQHHDLWLQRPAARAGGSRDICSSTPRTCGAADWRRRQGRSFPTPAMASTDMSTISRSRPSTCRGLYRRLLSGNESAGALVALRQGVETPASRAFPCGSKSSARAFSSEVDTGFA